MPPKRLSMYALRVRPLGIYQEIALEYLSRHGDWDEIQDKLVAENRSRSVEVFESLVRRGYVFRFVVTPEGPDWGSHKRYTLTPDGVSFLSDRKERNS